MLLGLMTSAILAPSGVLEAREDETASASDADRPLREASTLGGGDVVRARRFYKGGRVEVYPHFVGWVVNNSFANRIHALTGLGVAWHPQETTFLEGTLDWFPIYPFYDDLKPLNLAIARELPLDEAIPAVSREKLYLGATFGWAPIYGKINIVSSFVQNFDVSFLFSIGLLNIQKDTYIVATDPETDATILDGPIEGESESNTFLTPGVGLGARVFLTPSITFRLDARFHAYIEKVVNYEEVIDSATQTFGTRNLLQDSLILSAGLSGFFPWAGAGR